MTVHFRDSGDLVYQYAKNAGGVGDRFLYQLARDRKGGIGAHNPEMAGSIPAPATRKSRLGHVRGVDVVNSNWPGRAFARA